MSHNPYIILELPITATIREVNKQYRKIALKYHPDKNPGNKSASEMFIKMKEAYDLIKSGAYKPNTYKPFKEPSARTHKPKTREPFKEPSARTHKPKTREPFKEPSDRARKWGTYGSSDFYADRTHKPKTLERWASDNAITADNINMDDMFQKPFNESFESWASKL